jgi:hypothetical protein
MFHESAQLLANAIAFAGGCIGAGLLLVAAAVIFGRV